MTESKFLTYAEVARRLHLPVGSLYGKVRRCEIPHLRFGRARSGSTPTRSSGG
jgi:excisionase family DNA binding protein